VTLVSPADFEPYIFPVLFLGGLALMGYKMYLGAVALRAQGRAIRPTLPTDALFAESGASGNSERSLMTRMGGASRVLLVWVTRREFVVESIFPFNVFMYGNPYDLEHRVPIQSLTSVEEADKGAVLVSFQDAEHQSHTLRLFVKNPKALIATLESLDTPSGNSLVRARGQ
jgi:hypothetical protein